MTTLNVWTAALGLALALPTAVAQQPAPRTIAFTGFLADAQGRQKPDGAYSVTLSLYPAVSGGSADWTETKSVHATRGLFSTALGDAVPFPLSLDFSRALFVGVRLDGSAEMTPRLALQSVPYALFARALAKDPAQLANASGGAMVTNGTDVTVAGDLRFGPGAQWSALAATAPRQMLAGQVTGGSGDAVGAGFSSSRVAKGVYLITTPLDPRIAIFTGTVVGGGTWTINVVPEEDSNAGMWHYRVETRNSAFLNDPQAFNFLIVAER